MKLNNSHPGIALPEVSKGGCATSGSKVLRIDHLETRTWHFLSRRYYWGYGRRLGRLHLIMIYTFLKTNCEIYTHLSGHKHAQSVLNAVCGCLVVAWLSFYVAHIASEQIWLCDCFEAWQGCALYVDVNASATNAYMSAIVPIISDRIRRLYGYFPNFVAVCALHFGDAARWFMCLLLTRHAELSTSAADMAISEHDFLIAIRVLFDSLAYMCVCVHALTSNSS